MNITVNGKVHEVNTKAEIDRLCSKHKKETK